MEGGGIGLDRWEAEVQQHQDYLDKMARVKERRQANLKKMEQAGFTCNLEKCGEHFSSLPLYKEHVVKHKAKMRDRLVCSEQISKTEVCEQKFTNRRDYNQHQKEHRIKRLKVFQQDVRSVLLVNKLGLLLEAFDKEYRTMVGQMVPYKVLGFSSSLELLQACPEAVEIQKVEGGHTLLMGKPTDQQLDMARMVANQREECRGYDYRTGEVLKNQSHATKKNLEKVSGERKRQVTPFLKEQVGKMMELEEHQAGLELETFLDAYKELHDYPLEPVNYGFFGLCDLLHHGLSCTVDLKLSSGGQWMVFPRHSSSSSLAELPTSLSSEVRQLLASRPDGLEVEALPLVYSQFGSLHLPSLGFGSMEELGLALAQEGVCTIRTDINGALLLIAIPTSDIVKETSRTKESSDISRTLATECGDQIDFKVQQLQELNEDTWLEVLSAPRAGKVVAQFANNREKLWRLEQELEAYYCSGGGVIFKIPNLGADVVHLSPQSGTWQRGRVVGLVEEEVEVAYWDYQGLARVHFSMLRTLETRFAKLPPQMVEVECSMLPKGVCAGDICELKRRHGREVFDQQVPHLNEEENFKRNLLAIMRTACELECHS